MDKRLVLAEIERLEHKLADHKTPEREKRILIETLKDLNEQLNSPL